MKGMNWREIVKPKKGIKQSVRNTKNASTRNDYLCLLAYDMLIDFIIIMENQNNNDRQKNKIQLLLFEALNENRFLKTQIAELQKRSSEIIWNHESTNKRLAQENQLIKDEIRQTKQRYNNLKREQEIYAKVTLKNQEKHQKANQIPLEMYRELELKLSCCESELKISTEKNRDSERQITILTDYINLKETVHDQNCRKLDKCVNELNTSSETIQIYEHKCKLLENAKSQLEQKCQSILKEKIGLQSKLQTCTQYVKQMEEYYIHKIQNLTRINQTSILQPNNILRSNIKSSKSSFKDESSNRQVESSFQNRVSSFNLESQRDMKNYLSQLKQQFQSQIRKYEEYIKLLMDRLNNSIASTPFNLKESSSIHSRYSDHSLNTLIESKVTEEKSIDSIKFVPYSSFSSNIKQNLNKKIRFEEKTKIKNQSTKKKQLIEINTPIKYIQDQEAKKNKIHFL